MKDKLKLQCKHLFLISNKKIEMDTKYLKPTCISKVDIYNFWNVWNFWFLFKFLAFVTDRFQVIEVITITTQFYNHYKKNILHVVLLAYNLLLFSYLLGWLFIHIRIISSSLQCGIFQYWILIHLFWYVLDKPRDVIL